MSVTRVRLVCECGRHDSSFNSASIIKTAAFKGGRYTSTTFHINVSETPMVFVSQHIADTGDLRPGDLRLLRLEFRRIVACGFRYDLAAVLYANAV